MITGHEEELVKRWMRPWANFFIDVGAGFGTYCINLCGCFREVWAFEPCEENRKKLLQYLSFFKVRNVRVFPQAMGSKKEFRNLYQTYESSLTAGFLKAYAIRKDNFQIWVGYQPTIRRYNLVPIRDYGPVEVTTLNEVVGNREVDLIKVDVEGFEKEVLIGASEIMRQVKHWQIEVHNAKDLAFFHQRFNKLGYKVEEVHRNMELEHYIIAWRNNFGKG